jgi:hypothetical protein
VEVGSHDPSEHVANESGQAETKETDNVDDTTFVVDVPHNENTAENAVKVGSYDAAENVFNEVNKRTPMK